MATRFRQTENSKSKEVRICITVMEIMKRFFTKDEDLYDKKIEDVFTDEFFSSNFWLYWRTMFAFEEWHSALEMKLYIQGFIHHIGGLPDFSALKFTKYNQYESLILPMVKYLEERRIRPWGMMITRLSGMILSAAAGSCGATSQPRILPSAIRINSAPIPRLPIGNLQPSLRWMTGFLLIYRKSARGIPSAARW